MLNRRLAAATPLKGAVLEIGNGHKRRGIETGATATLDLSAVRAPDVQGDAIALPFRDGALDGVICCETLQYIPKHGHALEEIHRVLRPGGALLFSVPWKLRSQPDEGVEPERWDVERIRTQMWFFNYRIKRIEPLWPPLRFHTSGWFIHARAV